MTSFISIVVCVSAGFIAGVVLGGYWVQQDWREDALKRKFARYNPTTGKFEWVEPASSRFEWTENTKC